MKKVLSLFGIIVVLGIVAFIDSPTDAYHGFVPNYNDGLGEEDTEEVSAEVEKEAEHDTYSSLEFVKEGTRIEDGYMVETYREYEIYEDEDGNVIKKEPTSNLNHLRYKIDQNS